MQIVIEGTKYGIRFTHLSDFHDKLVGTRAEFIRLDDSSGYPMPTNVCEESKCHPNDNFDKSKGRKVALAKLLKHVNSDKALLGMTHKLSKIKRRQIWNIYFQEHRKV